MLLGFFAGWAEALPDTPVDETPSGPEVPEKIKKRYRKKKTKLEEAFPAYLQVSHLSTETKQCNAQFTITTSTQIETVFDIYTGVQPMSDLVQ